MDDNDDHNDHIFDKDPALEYIFFQEATKEARKKDVGKNGCCFAFLLIGAAFSLAALGITKVLS